MNHLPENLNTVIDESIINDQRMFPLFSKKANLHLQFYILEVQDKEGNSKAYGIVYGFIIETTNETTSSKLNISSFTKVYNTTNVSFSIGKVSLYNKPELILNLTNRLLAKNGLKETSKDLGLDFSGMDFEVYLGKRSEIDVVVRPIIFNETNTLISRYFYSKNALTSPYSSLPTYSLVLSNLDKLSIFRDINGDFYGEWQKGLANCLNYLQDETTLSFKGISSSRFGNIEFINSQCADQFQVPNVWFENKKQEVQIQHKKTFTSRTVEVVIKSNKFTEASNLIINCYLTNGNQITLDNCQNVYHKKNEDISVSFSAEEEITQVAVSIWRECDGKYQIWYKHSFPLLRNMNISMGAVSTHGTVTSPWLEKIEKNDARAKLQANKAKEVSKASYQEISIGGYDLDPWVNADWSFGKLVEGLFPQKTEACFFPRGWNNETNEYGAISFLEWFKDICKQAKTVVIQDPYFDTLGLEFLARTDDSSTTFNILTCTQVQSYDDNDSINGDKPQRSERIKTFIAINPSVMGRVRLKIHDLESSGTNNRNLLHDRYILVFKGDQLEKGFHLSNSIQNATQSYPLLITPIPYGVLQEVNQHISCIIDESETNENISLLTLYDFELEQNKARGEKKVIIADEQLYNKLHQEFPDKDKINTGLLKSYVSIATSQSLEHFSKFWSTFGYFLANINYVDEILDTLKPNLDTSFNKQLRGYLEYSIQQPYPIGFDDEPNFHYETYQFLFEYDFENSLSKMVHADHYLREHFGFGNYGVSYGCRLLLELDVQEYFNLIYFIQDKYNGLDRGKDLSQSSLLKLNSIVFYKLVTRLFWLCPKDLIESCIKSNRGLIKVVSLGALIKSLVNSDNINSDFEAAQNLVRKNLKSNQVLVFYIYLLFEIRFTKLTENKELVDLTFEAITDTLKQGYSKREISNTLKKLIESGYPLIEKEVTNRIQLKLVELEVISLSDACEFWFNELLATIRQFDSTHDYSGKLDLTAWAYFNAETKDKMTFLEKIKKELKFQYRIIQRPFFKGRTDWGEAFEKLLLIRTVLIIVKLYARDNGNDCPTIELDEIIEQITNSEKNYQFKKNSSKTKTFSDQKMAEYTKSG